MAAGYDNSPVAPPTGCFTRPPTFDDVTEIGIICGSIGVNENSWCYEGVTNLLYRPLLVGHFAH